MTAQRRDPRLERAQRRVPGTARSRYTIELGLGGVMPSANLLPEADSVSLVMIETPAFLVAVVVDTPDGVLTPLDRQLIGAGRLLADSGGGAVVLVTSALPEDAGAAGADRLVRADGDDPPSRAAALASLIDTLAPRHVLFADTADGGDLARRVAVLRGEALFADVEFLTPKQAVRACRAGRAEQRAAPGKLIAILPDIAAPYSGPPREARRLADQDVAVGSPAPWQIKSLPGDPARLKLEEADFVVAAGNGVTDFDSFHALVEALGATPGASRVVCDAGLMPRDRQVGASGTVLSGTCYFALGIAGAPQHLEGVARVEHVVAVNTDLHAAMIARAGLAIVHDAQAVIPALLAALAERRR